jgi:hypothetical protein
MRGRSVSTLVASSVSPHRALLARLHGTRRTLPARGEQADEAGSEESEGVGWGHRPAACVRAVGGAVGDYRWRPRRGDDAIISLSDLVALAVIHTDGMVPVVGDTHRDLPGALPTHAIVSLEGDVILKGCTKIA